VATVTDDNAADEKSDKSIWQLLNIRCTSLPQTGSRTCLKKAFCKMYVTITLRNPDNFILVQAKESVDSQKFHRV
jgi:hypothetical protein